MHTKPKKHSFKLPKRLKNQDGQIRKVGVEFEFANVEIKKVVQIITDIFGGSPSGNKPFQQKVCDTIYGDFTVELDAHLLKDRKYLEYFQKLGIEIENFMDEDKLEKIIIETASLVVPLEVVTPPIPFNELSKVESLRQALHENRAEGTKSSFIYAFGLHLNPEAPSLEPTILLQYLRSFLLLYDWIVKEADIDLTRRITPYINPFEEEYIRYVLSPDYSPDTKTLIVDYLKYNPTRNRPLDFTPLFASIDEKLVQKSVVEKDLVKKRPAFHYRLPNCLIDQPDWSIASEWNQWVAVEDLAEQPEKIKKMCSDYLETKKPLMNYLGNEWLSKIKKWLE